MTTPNTKEAPKETLSFQAEVRELLKLMIHSLYSHREIFLRELISNASDANDKLRFEALSKPELMAGEPELAIWIEADADKKTLSIRDNGIGMSRDEAVSHLGHHRPLGHRGVLQEAVGRPAEGLAAHRPVRRGVLFGIHRRGACRSTDAPRRSCPPARACAGSPRPTASFTVETIERPERGTTIVLHLKDDAAEFLDSWHLRSLVRRYSDHIAFPVRMPKEGEATLEYEAVNRGTALWARPKAEIKDEEYIEFYRHLTHDSGEPLDLVAQPRRRQARLHKPGLHPRIGALRPVATRWRARAQAVRAPRFHHG